MSQETSGRLLLRTEFSQSMCKNEGGGVRVKGRKNLRETLYLNNYNEERHNRKSLRNLKKKKLQTQTEKNFFGPDPRDRV